MDKQIAIEFSNVHKSFRVYKDKGHTIKDYALFRSRRKFETRDVLKGISFNLAKGEAVGLIGENGCGKSTTLKLLSRIIYPDSGTINISGRVSSLIELGAGFHPDMTGRENIYINASIFGLNKKEIDQRIDSIIEFSELEKYIDNPVRTYSSGMYMRLAFSVAINVDADILLIDEILAVGDVNFQNRCFQKLQEIKSNGVTIVIVSHALEQIERFCEKSIWIKDGQIEKIGIPHDVHEEYLEYMGRSKRIHSKNNQVIRNGNGYACIKRVEVKKCTGEISQKYRTGESIVIEATFSADREIDDVLFGIGVYNAEGKCCYGTNTSIDGLSLFKVLHGGKFMIQLTNAQLLPGEYSLDLAIVSSTYGILDYWKQAYLINIYSPISDIGVMRMDHCWNVEV